MPSVAKLFLEFGDMLVLSMTLLGAFTLMSILTDSDVDDDDGPGGGIMIPVTSPTS